MAECIEMVRQGTSTRQNEPVRPVEVVARDEPVRQVEMMRRDEAVMQTEMRRLQREERRKREDQNVELLRINQEGGCFMSYTKIGYTVTLFGMAIVATIFLTAVLTQPKIVQERNMKFYEIQLENAIKSKAEQRIKFAKAYRLQNNVNPVHYRVKLQPIFNDPLKPFSFSGSLTITMNCFYDSLKIELNSKNLDIDHSTAQLYMQMPQTRNLTGLNNFNSKPQRSEITNFFTQGSTNDEYLFMWRVENKIKKWDYRRAYDKVILWLTDPLEVGRNYTLQLNFNGTMAETPQGFHYIRYLQNNIPRYYASTQFEPVFAREAFPCFDEPKYRAQFEMSIMRKSDVVSLSNAELQSTEEIMGKPGYVWDHYKRTPAMPIYMLAYAIGDFVAHPPQITKHGIEIRVWALAHQQKSQRTYVELIAPQIMDYFMDTFEAKYPFNKLDIVFNTMTLGGMENWGMITSNDDMLFVNSSDNANSLETTFQILSHEIAHLWFGDLVSINWWDDMWIKEGLTQFIELLPMSRFLSPEHGINTTFTAALVNNVMGSDQYLQSPAVSHSVTDPNEISERFDDITYEKGAAIFRMLNFSLTEPVLTKGLKYYLKNFAFRAAVPHDIYDSLTRALKEEEQNPFRHLNITVDQFMKTWVEQPGYPVVTLTRDYETGDVTITQKRFLLNTNISNDNLWYIPITYYTSEDHNNFQNEKLLMMNNKKVVTFAEMVPASNKSWIVCNMYQKGMFRVNYDPTNWQLLIKQVNENKFPLALKLTLMEDALSLAQINLVDFHVALNLTLFIRYESNHNAWVSWAYAVEFLNNYFGEDAIYGLMKEYFAEVISLQYFAERGTDENSMKMNVLIKQLACWTELDHCVFWARQEFDKLLKVGGDQNVLSEDYRETIYCSVVRHGGQFEWNYLWNRSLAVRYEDASEYLEILRALTCSTEKWILKRYLIIAFLEKQVEPAALIHILSYYSSPAAVQTGFEFLVKNSKFMRTILADNVVLSINVYKRIFWSLSTEEQLRQLLELFDPKDEFLLSKAQLIKTAVERIRSKIEFGRHHAPRIRSWLQTHLNKTYF